MKFTTIKSLNFITLLLFSLFISRVNAANVNVISGGVGLSSGYSSLTGLSGLFNDLNNNPQTGQVIVISIASDLTNENNTISLNANTWTSLTIEPSGHRSISNSLFSSSFLVFNGADHVTIDGLNDRTNSLEISNTGTTTFAESSTITFKGGASNNVITNCTIRGVKSFDGSTNGGVIYFAADALTANGNDNNTISNCTIGPEFSSLPSRCIFSNGSSSTTAIGNSGNIITNNNIYNYFKTNDESAGIYIKGGSNSWTISNNRFYQTTTRTWSTGALHSAININDATAISGAAGFTITGNIIGYSSDISTGTYTLNGSTGSFAGIRFNGITSGAVSNISNNTIAAINVNGVTSSGTGSTSPFVCIFILNGLVTSNNNIIGSQTQLNSISFSGSASDPVDMIGMYNGGTDAWTSNGNQIGGLYFNYSTSDAKTLHCMWANTSATGNWTASQNVIGGTINNSIINDAFLDSKVIYGLSSSTPSTLTSNTIRNFYTGSLPSIAIVTGSIGIRVNGSTHLISQNSIYNLDGLAVAFGIQCFNSSGVVENNFIYNLKISGFHSGNSLRGITLDHTGSSTYRNNMIVLGVNEAKSVQIFGIYMLAGQANFYHNSVYIGGTNPGNNGTYAYFESMLSSVRSLRDNIFMNVRTTTGAGTGKNYGIQIGNSSNLTIDNNVYYTNGPGTIFGKGSGTDANNLSAWQTLVGQDAASFEENPQFNNPLNAIPDLHLHPTNPTPAEGNGFDVGVTNDIDGQIRSGFTPVDIGADAANANRIQITLNAKLLLQGFYTSGGLMQNSGTGYLNACNVPGAGSSDVDTIFLSAMENVAPYALVDKQPGILKTNGDITVSFVSTVLPNKQYYIRVEHQNSAETWSKFPVMFSANTEYSFLSAASQAYSNNMVETSDNFGWAIISGDLNKDNAVDGGDFLELDPMIQNGQGGYSLGDLNGDGAVDGNDFLLLDPNLQVGFGAAHP